MVVEARVTRCQWQTPRCACTSGSDVLNTQAMHSGVKSAYHHPLTQEDLWILYQLYLNRSCFHAARMVRLNTLSKAPLRGMKVDGAKYVDWRALSVLVLIK